MEKETKHTPEDKTTSLLPWRLITYKKSVVHPNVYTIKSADGFVVAEVNIGKWECEANAELIVTAVNSYDKLQTELSEMKKEREELVSMLEIALSLLQCDAPLSDKLEYDIQQIILKNKK